MLRLFVGRLMYIRCCFEQDAAADRAVLDPNHYSEAPGGHSGFAGCTWTVTNKLWRHFFIFCLSTMYKQQQELSTTWGGKKVWGWTHYAL